MLSCLVGLCIATSETGCGGRASDDADENGPVITASGGTADMAAANSAGGLRSTVTAEPSGGTAGTAGTSSVSEFTPCPAVVDLVALLGSWPVCYSTPTQSLERRNCVVPLEVAPLDLDSLTLVLDCAPVPSSRPAGPVWHYDPELTSIVIDGAECDAIQRGEMTRADLVICSDGTML